MSFANVVIYVALIAYILYGKAKGWPMKTPKKLFLLPALVVIIGYGDATHGTTKPLEVTLTAVGGAVSLGLGLLRGRADKISPRNGAQFVQWGGWSFALFATNLVVKGIFDAIGLAAGSTFSAVGKSLVLSLGLTLLGEAITLFVRSGAATSLRSGGGLGSLRSSDATKVDTTVTAPPLLSKTYRAGERVQQQPAPPWGRTGQGLIGRPIQDLRGGVTTWLRQQIDQTATTESSRDTPPPARTNDVGGDRGDRGDRQAPRDHHEITRPS